MSFFKPKEKELDFETQEDLPKFHFDVNGFLMFDDPSLGGCAIYEVIPTVMTGAVTHRETLGYRDVDTKSKSYTPERVMEVVGDRRRDALLQWIDFLNGLLPEDDADTQTHVQIILKKTHPDEWWDAYGYAIDAMNGHVGDAPFQLGRHGSAYRKSYEQLLADLGDAFAESNGMWNGASYDVLAYIVVSYTPSSEGWWLDGRDDDYYVQDSADKSSLFSVDGFVEKVGKSINNRRERKEERNDYNVATALFPIDEDRIAMVLQTRMTKLERRFADYQTYQMNAGGDLAFTIRRTHMVDNSMLIAFWQNPLTSYRYKVWNMKTDISDVIMGMRNDEAVASGDVSVLDASDPSDDDLEEFLSEYRGVNANDDTDIADVSMQDEQDEMETDVMDAWADIDPSLVAGSANANHCDDDDQFLGKYRKASISGITTVQADDEHADSRNDTRPYAQSNRLAGNASYAQTRRSHEVHDDMVEIENERRHAAVRHEAETMEELGVSDNFLDDAPDITDREVARDKSQRAVKEQEGDTHTRIPSSIGHANVEEDTNPFMQASRRRDAFVRQRQLESADDGEDDTEDVPADKKPVQRQGSVDTQAASRHGRRRITASPTRVSDRASTDDDSANSVWDELMDDATSPSTSLKQPHTHNGTSGTMPRRHRIHAE